MGLIPYKVIRESKNGLTRRDRQLTRQMDAIPYQMNASLADDFQANTPDPFWTQSVRQGDGIAHTVSTADYGSFFIAGPYDLRGRALTIKAIPDGVRGVDRSFALASKANLTGDQDLWDHDSTTLAQGGANANDSILAASFLSDVLVPISTIDFDPVAHLWWQIRVSADGFNAYFDTSPDGVNWTLRGTSVSHWDRSKAYMGFGSGQYASPPISNNVDVQWASFGIVPWS